MSIANGAATAGNERPMVLAEDEHDLALVNATRPPDWENPTPAERYNLVVVGGGTAGLVAAAGAAGLGARVALVERRMLGGDCLNFGCVPSKALIASARAAAGLRRAESLGIRTAGRVEVDGRTVFERVRRLRASIAPHDSARRFRELGVDVFLGEGRFVSPGMLAVGEARLPFAKACIATGASPTVPPIPGLAECGYLTNETLFALEDLPRRMAIVGGGPIGSEMAQAFARLGTEVHLIEAGERLLGNEHEEAARIVARALERDGVHLYVSAKLVSVERTRGGRRLLLEGGSGRAIMLEVDELLIAVGRAPNVDGLGLEEAGVRFDRRLGVEVDDHLRTSNRHIYAAGDVATRFKFTHVADALSRIVLRNALFLGRARASALNVPWCTYTDPEVASTGLTAADARARGIELDTLRVEMSTVDRAVLGGDEEGFLEVRLARGNDRIVGATLVASHAGEMISELSAWMAAGKGLKGLSGVIHPYPSQAEAFKKAGDAMARTSLKPWIKVLFARFLVLRRSLGGARD